MAKMIKLLITFLLLLSPIVSAQYPKDKICLITVGKDVAEDAIDETISQQIKELGCVYNNALHVRFLGSLSLRPMLFVSDKWCDIEKPRTFGGMNGFSCVLYSIKPKEILTRE